MDRMSSGKIMIQFNIFSPCFLERQLSTYWYFAWAWALAWAINRITSNVLLRKVTPIIVYVLSFWPNNNVS